MIQVIGDLQLFEEEFWIFPANLSVDEETSDRCMSELIGSHKSHGESCDISSICAHTMTAPGLLGYGITHQILWTMLADKAGCTAKLQARLFELGRGDMTTLRQELCTNNYIQLRETVAKFSNGIIPAIQDLFLEQMFVCPSLGFVEFLDLDFLPQILSWQSESGCYGKMKRMKNNKPLRLDPELTGEIGEDYVDEEEEKNKADIFAQVKAVDVIKSKMNRTAENLRLESKLHDNRKFQKQNDAVWEMSEHKGRKLLVEKSMSGGCLAHKTAVASGALIMYLRYLCEPDANKLFSVKRKLRSAEPLLDRGKIVNIPQQVNPAQNNGSAIGGGAIYQKNILANRHDLNGDGGGGIEKLKMNLNRENELVNPLDRLDKFHKTFEEFKNTSNAKIELNGKESIQELNIINKAGAIKPIEDKLVINDKLDANKDDENYDYKYDDNNENDDEDEEEDEDEDEDEEYPDYDKRDDGEIDRNLNQYYDKDQNGELKPMDDNDNNPDNDNDDDDDDYNADDGYNDGYDDNDQENVHPHINARNIGHGKSRDYDKEGFDDDDDRLKIVKDYDDDEEDGDDYEYDDKNDMIEQRQEEETKNEFILGKPEKKVIDSRRPVMAGEHISEQSMLSTTTFVIFIISLVILVVLYRFIRKRRIRLRMGHKYFHV
ncbi:AP2/ERF domain-containing protein PFD0985w-like [Mercenaria mercenaria]|uniref:AP2/ERF domain-containing protein PFD0985w-like n=1 Tax=Mercenaria mercenaria TaxID=6596 RepID=UPI00234F37FA|nr:AP2/ERF domain-containing protein PFD0985w-like [Mercenaria mercenaria]